MWLVRLLSDIRATDLVDIAFVSLAVYQLLVLIRRARATFVLIGLLIVSGIYLVARQFNLRLTTSLLRAFFTVLLIAVVIIFQAEIRQFLERLASRSLRRKNRRSADLPNFNDPYLVLRTTLPELARKRIGAIMVLPGTVPLDRHLSGGFALNGKISQPLLMSIFDTHSAGHDGAVIVEGDRVASFGCRLPLSINAVRLQNVGTRHAAALGLSEAADCLCLVVSEERGTVSLAEGGELSLDVGETVLNQRLKAYFQQAASERRTGWKLLTGLRRYPFEKALAVFLSAFLWFFMVHESEIEYRTLVVPVEIALSSASGLQVEEVEPSEVRAVVAGTRRAFYFFDGNDVTLSLRLADPQPGKTTRQIVPSDFFNLPSGLELETIKPSRVRVTIKKSTP